MIPRTLSASALNVAGLCLSRYHAEYIERANDGGSRAADGGTALHGALEMYVKIVYVDQSEKPSPKLLLDLYRMSYIATFGTADTETREYVDGVEMLQNWFMRDSLGANSGRRVYSLEEKKTFPIKTSAGVIPYTYIIDRCDVKEDDPNVIYVVDYKSNVLPVNGPDLKKKIQPRSYALAKQIEFPDATEIWVEFDMLRHDGPRGCLFTREENLATWRRIKAEAKRIVNTDPKDARETLNPECRFCVKKQSCRAVARNISVGGVHTFPSAMDAVDARANLEYQKAAVEAAIKELDSFILAEARLTDTLEFRSDQNQLEITVSSRREVDPGRVEQIIGAELFSKYGGRTFTVGTVDKLLKGKELTPQQKSDLKFMIHHKKGEPAVKASPISAIDED